MPATSASKLSDLLRPAYRHLAAGEVEAAKSLLEEASRQWPKAGLQRLLAARIAEAEGRRSEAIPLFRDAATALRAEAERNAENPRLALALAHALAKSGDPDAAASALASARQRGADPAETLRVERVLAWGCKDWHWLRRVAEELIAVKPEPAAEDFVALAGACRNSDDIDGAAAAAARALERDPRNIEAATLAAWAAAQQPDLETAIARYRQLALLAPENPRWAFEIIRLLVYSGRVQEGSERLDEALCHWPKDPALRAFALICGFRTPDRMALAAEADEGPSIGALRERELRRVARNSPADTELQRPAMTDDKASDVILAEAANAETVVLVFTALNDVMSMPLPIFDRYLAAFGVTAVYLKDFRRLSYLRGIVSLGSDDAAARRALQGMCERLGAKRLCTIGYSAGGAAAIRYGVQLGADRVVSFAGHSHRVRGPTSRLDRQYNMINDRMAGLIADEELDLRRFLTGRGYSSSIEIVYAAAAARDKVHAEHLSGLAGVTLRPVAGCDDHELIRWLALHGDLRAMLAELLGLGPR